MAKVICVRSFIDLKENRTRNPQEIIECDDERAKVLVDSGYCVMQESEEKPAKKAAKKR